jgi:predicted nucleic acid-binding protein
MGSLALPASSLVYTDSDIIICSVETHAAYWPVLQSLWQAARAGSLAITSSELTLMETLIGPLRSGDEILQSAYQQVLQSPEVCLLPISQAVLGEAARLRAGIVALRTPDALHAATATLAGCTRFLTNDIGFRRIPGLPVVLLDEVLAWP